MRKIVLSIFAVLMLSFTMVAQNLRITGTVTDEDGQSVMYATVKVVGTSITAYADMDGVYTITAPADATLEFSAQSFATKQEKVNNRTTINVVMATDATLMQEFVLVGYGTGRELGSISGSVNTVGENIVGNRPTGNVADALQGQVPGLAVSTNSGEPTATSTLTIHGVGSISAGTTPLLVIDGVTTNMNLNGINNADIESITVLRDASATSIYGSRAANGVIYVTTKKGKKSANNDAIIKFNAKYGLSTVARSKTDYMSADQLLDFQLKYGEIDNASYKSFKEFLAKNGEMDWFKYSYDDAPYFGADLAISGGSATTNYYVSGGYEFADGTAPRSSSEKYTFMTNLESQIKPWASMGVSLNASYNKYEQTISSSSGSGGAYVGHPSWFAMLTPGYYPGYDENGDYIPLVGDKTINPRYVAQVMPSSGESFRYYASMYLNINPMKGLNIKSVLGANGYDSFAKNAWLPSSVIQTETYSGRSAVRSYDIINTNTVEYKFNINKIHNFVFLAGHEGTRSRYVGFSATKSGLVDDRVIMMSNAINVESNDVTDSFERDKFISFFGQAAYNYRDKYYLDLSVRTDGSSRFGTNNRYATFYSVGGVWNVKKEDFLKNIREISSLRLRANYGTQGNSSISNYMVSGYMLSASIPYAGMSVFYTNTDPGNPNLKWETSKQFTVGFDIGLWDRLNLSANYWHKKTVDLLISTPMALSSGFTYQMQNVGEMTNQGVEVELGGVIFNNKDWYIFASANFSYQHNKIDKLYGDVRAISASGLFVGENIASFFLPVHMGIDSRDGLPMWDDGNGNPVKNFALAKEYIIDGKSYIPPYFGGLNLNIAWRDLSLSAYFSYAFKKYALNNEKYFLTNLGMSGYNRSKDLIDNVWTQYGDVTDYPRYGTPGQFDTSLLENASYIRLKNLELSYSLPKKWMQQTGFLSSVRVYFQARNLLTITSYTGADPEPTSSVLGAQYPNTRQYVGGVEITF